MGEEGLLGKMEGEFELLFKMFHLDQKIEGRLREFKNDYFS